MPSEVLVVHTSKVSSGKAPHTSDSFGMRDPWSDATGNTKIRLPKYFGILCADDRGTVSL